MPVAPTPRALRVRQGVVLLIGAVVIELAIGGSGKGFFWTPLTLGLTYLLGALAGGRRGSYWATAVVLVGWGTAVILTREYSPDLDTSGLYLLGAGGGAVIGSLLARLGFAVDALGMAATAAVGGLLLSFEPRWHTVLGDARVYAALIAVVGIVNLLLALRADPAPIRPVPIAEPDR